MLQAIFSDGLTYVSVFIEPYRPRSATSARCCTQLGATQTLMRRHGDWWVTVVGDVPPATLQQFAPALNGGAECPILAWLTALFARDFAGAFANAIQSLRPCRSSDTPAASVLCVAA